MRIYTWAIAFALVATSAQADDWSETLALRVKACWNVGGLDQKAAEIAVLVAVPVDKSGAPLLKEMRMSSRLGGDEPAARRTYDTAEKAIRRCMPADFRASPAAIGLEFTFSLFAISVREILRSSNLIET